jgi:hypothetical protein
VERKKMPNIKHALNVGRELLKPKKRLGKSSWKRFKLWQKDPDCFYCGVETVFYNPFPGKADPDNLATVEHLNSKLSERRNTPNHNGERRVVLACRKCNHSRGAKEYNQLPLEERRKRSRRSPK